MKGTSLAGTSLTRERVEDDFYATDPKSLELLSYKLEEDNIKLNRYIWECACGQGHLSEVLKNKGYSVCSTDLVDRGYGIGDVDFLGSVYNNFSGDILTNPPYKYAQDFIEHSLHILQDGHYCIMFLKIQFLEGKVRKEMFKKYPPKYIYVFSERQNPMRNGQPLDENGKKWSSTMCFAWFIWEKGFTGEPVIRWI